MARSPAGTSRLRLKPPVSMSATGRQRASSGRAPQPVQPMHEREGRADQADGRAHSTRPVHDPVRPRMPAAGSTSSRYRRASRSITTSIMWMGENRDLFAGGTASAAAPSAVRTRRSWAQRGVVEGRACSGCLARAERRAAGAKTASSPGPQTSVRCLNAAVGTADARPVVHIRASRRDGGSTPRTAVAFELVCERARERVEGGIVQRHRRRGRLRWLGRDLPSPTSSMGLPFRWRPQPGLHRIGETRAVDRRRAPCAAHVRRRLIVAGNVAVRCNRPSRASNAAVRLRQRQRRRAACRLHRPARRRRRGAASRELLHGEREDRRHAVASRERQAGRMRPRAR